MVEVVGVVGVEDEVVVGVGVVDEVVGGVGVVDEGVGAVGVVDEAVGGVAVVDEVEGGVGVVDVVVVVVSFIQSCRPEIALSFTTSIRFHFLPHRQVLSLEAHVKILGQSPQLKPI